MAPKHSLDGSELPAHAGGRPPALQPEHIAVLLDVVMERAHARLQEIADELHHRSGLRLCTATVLRALCAQGIVRIKSTRRAYSAPNTQAIKRYGYTATSEPAAEIKARFVLLPKRRVVERAHAWTERWRRTVMHHDRKLAVSAA